MTRRRNDDWRFMGWFVLGLVLVLVGGVGVVGLLVLRDINRESGEHSLFNDPARMEQSKERAARIIAALEEHRRVSGGYPKSLDDLGMTIGDDLLPTAGRPQWHYWTDETRTRFALSFGVGEHAYPCYSYDSLDGRWSRDS